jgi:hypothetical protein
MTITEPLETGMRCVALGKFIETATHLVWNLLYVITIMAAMGDFEPISRKFKAGINTSGN